MTQLRYKYQAMDLAGKRIIGTIDSQSEEEVASLLKQQGFFITGPIRRERSLKVPLRENSIINDEKLTDYAKKLGMLLKGGLPIIAAMKILITEEKKAELKEALNIATVNLLQGKTLTQSLRATKIFPLYFLQTIEIGEISGSLAEAFQSLAQFYTKKGFLKQQIKKALIYPTIVLTGAVGVLIIFALFILPETSRILAKEGADLPLLSKLMFALVSPMGLWTIIGLAALIGFIYFLIGISPNRDKISSKVIWVIPFVNKIYQLFIYHNLTRGLGFMLNSGMALLKALQSMALVTRDWRLTNKLIIVETSIKKGLTLTEAMTEAELLGTGTRELVRVGEETGVLGEVFQYMSVYYEEQLELELNKVTSYFEPLLVILLTILVALVAGSILLPMFEITSKSMY
ncbi:MAG: type II secretion system F family protein [Bacillota bacterium]|nr:type II secretion system F family protein [Bacillota bacterium]